jgi:ABC-2 type transport system permease protein
MMGSLRAQVRSEFRKVRTTRTAGGLLAGVVALTLLASWGAMSDVSVTGLGAGLAAVVPAIGILYVVTVFVLVMAVRSYTDEHRHGSIVPTLLADPARRRIVVAKVIVMAACSVVFTLIALTVGAGFTAVWIVAKGATLSVAWGSLAAIAGKGVLIGVLWSVLGVGIGVAVQHQVAAIVGTLMWLLVAEGLLGGFLPEVSKYLPAHAADAVLGATGGDPVLLAPAIGGLLLAGWAAISAGVGSTLFERRDVA